MPFAKRTKEIGQADCLPCPPNLPQSSQKPGVLQREQIVWICSQPYYWVRATIFPQGAMKVADMYVITGHEQE